MKQKIVIKVQLSSHKHKAKAMEIASVSQGVTSVAISGEEKDQVEVIGEGMDPVKLTASIRKKVSRNANLVPVEEVKPKDEPKKEEVSAQGVYYYPNQYYPQPVCTCEVYNPNP